MARARSHRGGGRPLHGAYAGANKAARKAVMTAAGIIRVQLFAAVPCFARGATEDSNGSMASLGFGPVAGGLPDLYVHEPIAIPPEKAA